MNHKTVDHVGYITRKPEDFKESLRKREGVTCECMREHKVPPKCKASGVAVFVALIIMSVSGCAEGAARHSGREEKYIKDHKSTVSQQKLQTWNDLESC